ncbi:hypothetical protein [Hydrogenophaga borbori]|uniref:hypothetical protein n=1 Tax=Hydrogenophaga borbori TaxID=2294117 RepID=UPI00301E2F48
MEERWCSACGELFLPRPQCPSQSFCSQVACQKERKLLWQRIKRKSDPDYVANQAKASSAWARRNPQYWRHYRAQRVSAPADDDAFAPLMAGASMPAGEDASSRGSGAGSPAQVGGATFLVDLELGPQLVLRMSIRIERVEPGQKSSGSKRKETT